MTQLPGLGSTSSPAYRYLLTRAWDAALPVLVWVMLNPSTATDAKNDPTICRCIELARREGFGGIIVVNLFALRATDPRDLDRAIEAGIDAVGANNDATIEQAVRERRVCVAWGNNGLGLRANDVLGLLRNLGVQPECFGTTQHGAPVHPLARGRNRIPADAHLQPFPR